MVPILFVMMDWLLEKAMATFFPSSNDALIAKLQEHRRQEMAKTASSQNKTLGSATSPIVVEMTNKSIA